MEKLKVGMIGMAHTHGAGFLNALAAHPQIEIVGISDSTHAFVQPYDKHYPYYANYKELLQTDVQAIFVFSENVHHAQITIDAANAGKHVLCEKPLGTTYDEMKRMVEACKENGVQLMTAFTNRYSGPVMRAKEVLDRGELGRIIAVKATNKGALPRRDWFVDRSLAFGGALFDHSVHVLDLLNWMFDSHITEVYAESGTLFHNINIDDAGMLHFTYENGVIGVLDTSWSRAKAFPMKRDITLQITGTDGTLFVDVSKQANEVYSNMSNGAEWSDWSSDLRGPIVDDFVRCVLSNTPVPITGVDGMNAAVVAIAAYESVQRGAPVKVQL